MMSLNSLLHLGCLVVFRFRSAAAEKSYRFDLTCC
ncbi:hypothetical protein BRADI_3g18635v3 [Brachypodium distachyon]|uniref:Uncharacterized protein n=1 Tax=Brachypodium distachyon TaxID=15368 RepID=A0A2K2CY23_BRADI|nr:hypothetical protein BRADI_3g18635v3 [Brachypodium distachyon]